MKILNSIVMAKINLEQHMADNVVVREKQHFSLGTIEQCKEMFIDAFKLTDKTIDDFDKNFEWLPEYDQVVEWMSDNKGKGLLMTGSNGRGKSAILSGVLPLIFRAVKRKVIVPIASRHLYELDGKYKWCVCIEDIGADDVKNNWGNKLDAVEDAISHCEDRMKLLMMSSNLNKDQIIERYGIRIMDRIKRLCVIVVFKGKSKRK